MKSKFKSVPRKEEPEVKQFEEYTVKRKNKEGQVETQKRKRWFSPEKLKQQNKPQIKHDEVKPEINLNLKLEVASFPMKERHRVQECAEVLEEILIAVNDEKETLYPRQRVGPAKILNQYKLDKL